MYQKNKGFTLIEIVIVVAIIAIIAAVAVPSYVNSKVRSRVTEGLAAVNDAKTTIARATSVAELNTAIINWNAQAGGAGAASKYVASVLFNANDEIVVTINGANVGGSVSTPGIPPNTNTIVYRPYVSVAGVITPLRATLNGSPGAIPYGSPVLWGCSSQTSAYSNNLGLNPALNPITPGTLLPLYAPSSCR